MPRRPKADPRRGARDARALPPGLQRAMCRRWPPSAYSRGQTLYYQGHGSYGLFHICSGTIRLTRENGGAPAEAGPGTLLGVRELLTGVPHAHTATVGPDPARVSFIDKTEFLDLIARQHSIAQAILQLLLSPAP